MNEQRSIVWNTRQIQKDKWNVVEYFKLLHRTGSGVISAMNTQDTNKYLDALQPRDILHVTKKHRALPNRTFIT